MAKEEIVPNVACPKCGYEKFELVEGFKALCSCCGTTFVKKCPCYFVATICEGCKYFAECKEFHPKDGHIRKE